MCPQIQVKNHPSCMPKQIAWWWYTKSNSRNKAMLIKYLNTGLDGTIPESLLRLPRLWELDFRGTGIQAAKGILPRGLELSASSTPSSASDLTACYSVAFSQPRLNASILSALYAPQAPSAQVLSDPRYTGFNGCQCADGSTLRVSSPSMGPWSYSCDSTSSVSGINATEKVWGGRLWLC